MVASVSETSAVSPVRHVHVFSPTMKSISLRCLKSRFAAHRNSNHVTPKRLSHIDPFVVLNDM